MTERGNVRYKTEEDAGPGKKLDGEQRENFPHENPQTYSRVRFTKKTLKMTNSFSK